MTGQHVTYINGQRCTTTESKRPAIASPGGTRATGSLGHAAGWSTDHRRQPPRPTGPNPVVVEHKEKLECKKFTIG